MNLAVWLLIAFLAATCAPTAQIIKDEDLLKRRAEEYWGYRIKGEWDRAYLYEDAGFREKVDITKYVNRMGRSVVKWEGFSIVGTRTDGTEGYVKLNTKYRYLIAESRKGIFERAVEEKWIRKDGLWYRQGFGETQEGGKPAA